ncbi:MAG: adenylyltransferase/cytidyltransferase family protein [Methanobacteriaceae archaeon]|nr:adenylyltransferase/cytidyltransferase family protein [Methanobacteriaceae archaeon]
MIGISADFDPVHLGHVDLIQKARQVADEKGEEVVIYLNKGYSANHAPFFTSFEARSKMALEAGADRIVPIEGLHHRLTMAYTVPIRIAMMIEDGVRDYVDAADVSPAKIKKYASNFVKQGIFSGIPRQLPNRNVIRWYAVNEFLGKVLANKMEFHFIPESKVGEEKISGRIIRREIIDNNMEIPKSVQRLLPKSTMKILKEEINKDNIPGERNLEVLLDRLNNFSRPRLLEIAHLNAVAVEEIVQGRKYRKETSAWASLRKAGYGPVLTRLALSCSEENVTRREVYDLIRCYEKDGIIPPDQKVERVIERAWFVASSVEKGITSQEAHEKFRKGENILKKPPHTVDAGLHLRNFEIPSLKEGLEAYLYVDKRGMISCLLRTSERKMKSPLKLPAKDATYLRLLIDSQIVPLQGSMISKKRGWRVRIRIR